ncbi:MAG: DUF4340 domain-containing protein [Limisphaerales bacterium]
MNLKQFSILIVLVIVLGGAALMVQHRRENSWSNSSAVAGKKLLGDFQVNAVAQIRIQQGADELNLVKTNDLWRVAECDNYPADFSRISQFLLKLRDLKIVQAEQVGASQWPRLDLAAGAKTNPATVVEFRGDDEKLIRTLWLGKNHLHENNSSSAENSGDQGWPDGRYVMTSTNSDTVDVISDTLSEAVPQAAQWLDKTFFKVEKPETISVTFPQATNSWELTRTNMSANWKLADAKPGEKLDATKSSELSDALASPNLTDVVPNPKAAQTGLDQPKKIEIKTFDGFDYLLKIGDETNDNYYLTVNVTGSFPKTRTPGKNEKPADNIKLDKEFQTQLQTREAKLAQEQKFEHWVYLVPTWTINPLLKERSQLLIKKKVEPKAESKQAKMIAPKK